MSGVAFAHPWLLLLLAVGPALYVSWRRRPPPPGGSGRDRLALTLRLTTVSAVVLALAGPRLTAPPAGRAVVAVVDLSDSTAGAQEAAAEAVRALAATRGRNDLVGVVTFGADRRVEVPPAHDPGFAGFQTRPDGTFTDAAAALRLAGNLLPDGYGRQVVLVSDGRQNVGDAEAAAADLRAQSVRVDVVPIGGAVRPDAAVLGIEVPGSVRTGQAVAAVVTVRVEGPAAGSLWLAVDGREVARRDLPPGPGRSHHRFDIAPLEPGVHRLRAAVEAPADGVPQNDAAEAVVRVADRPRALVVEGAPGEASNLVAALHATGLDAQVVAPDEVPAEAAGLAAFDSVVLVDVPADAMAPGSQEAVAAAVRDLGRGLVVVGGTRSYGPGRWRDTPIEQVLPVRTDPPARRERPAVAVVVAMESMEDPRGDVVAVAAARSVVDHLGPDDEVGLLVMSREGSFFALPLGPVADRAAAADRILDTQLGDPPGYGPSIRLALEALAGSAAAVKHLILVADGDATADAGRYGPILDAAPGVTLSVVGVDTHDNPRYMAHMRELARLGGGRYYESPDGVQVAEFLFEATRDARRPWFEQGRFHPVVRSAAEVLAGVPLDRLPALEGYVAVTARPDSEVVLASPGGDPLLAARQYGLGRTVAWTSDSRGRWTRELMESQVSATLFGRMVAWTVGAPPGGEVAVEVTLSGRGLEATVTGPDGATEAVLTAAGPERPAGAIPLRRVAPGRWEGALDGARPGVHVLRATLRRGGETVGSAEVVTAVPYSPEYLGVGRDDALLGAVAGQGGAVLSRPAAAWAQRLPPVAVSRDVSWFLLLVAVVLWPLDVAVRRIGPMFHDRRERVRPNGGSGRPSRRMQRDGQPAAMPPSPPALRFRRARRRG